MFTWPTAGFQGSIPLTFQYKDIEIAMTSTILSFRILSFIRKRPINFDPLQIILFPVLLKFSSPTCYLPLPVDIKHSILVCHSNSTEYGLKS